MQDAVISDKDLLETSLNSNGEKSWQNHYKRQRAWLSFPDENLVRMLRKNKKINNWSKPRALDLGCGSGRHLTLLADSGFSVTGLDYVSLTPLAQNLAGLSFPLRGTIDLVQARGENLPFEPHSYQVVVAWGSLHYGSLIEMEKKIKEVKRVLALGGIFWGTMRADADTYLPRGRKVDEHEWIIDEGDISGTHAIFSTEMNVHRLLSDFSHYQIGYMERTPLGFIDKKIAHYFFEAIL